MGRCWTLAALGATVFVAGCATVEGAGRDINALLDRLKGIPSVYADMEKSGNKPTITALRDGAGIVARRLQGDKYVEVVCLRDSTSTNGARVVVRHYPRLPAPPIVEKSVVQVAAAPRPEWSLTSGPSTYTYSDRDVARDTDARWSRDALKACEGVLLNGNPAPLQRLSRNGGIGNWSGGAPVLPGTVIVSRRYAAVLGRGGAHPA